MLLYYWRPDNHWRDLDYGAGFHLNQKNELLHEVGLGQSVWAFLPHCAVEQRVESTP